jgi:nucleoside-diphosphate-sugar epimerase
MKVLVLGADGFVGRRVAAALAASDWAEPIKQGVPAQLPAALAGVDAVANCVNGRPVDITRAAHLLFAAAAANGRAIPIVHLSSMTVYGSARGIVAEDTALLPDLGAYAQAQCEADQLAAGNPNTIRLRPGCEYGPDCPQWSERVARWLLRRRLGDLGAGGDGYCNLLFIDDLVTAMLVALRRPELSGRAFNLALPDPPTWNEYFIGFAKALGAVPVRRVTRRRLALETKVLAPPLKIAEMLLARAGLAGMGLPPAIPPSLLRLCRQGIRMNVRQAELALGMQWTPLETGLQRAAQWCRRS